MKTTIPFKLGDRVKLKNNILQRHATSVPSHFGYTKEQFAWRDTLGKLEGKKGKITRLFEGSKHVNVKFGKALIGLDYTELERE